MEILREFERAYYGGCAGTTIRGRRASPLAQFRPIAAKERV
jgi:hypothetical protein